MKGDFTLLSCLVSFLFGHHTSDPNGSIQVQRFLELKGIIDCSRHHFSREGVVNVRCELILVPPCCLGQCC